MREKLIELLREGIRVDTEKKEAWILGGKVGDRPNIFENMADHLIKNGVTFAADNNVGRWIIHSSGRRKETTNWAECSECHTCGSPQWKVCPVCEARMVNDGE